MDLLPFTDTDLERSILERFATVVKTWPSRPAVAAGGQQLTYGELDRRSNGLAAAIMRRTLDSRAAVAVLLADQVAAVVAMLATWKAGTLCVPLDPAIPVARLDSILRDAEAGLLITAREESAILDGLADRAPRLHVDDCDLLAPVETPRVTVSAESVAGLFYTSGSTGEPKGVVRSHRSMLHRARCGVRSLAIQPDDRVSSLHSLSSYAGLRGTLTALLGGAALLPFDIRRAGLGALADWIRQQEVSVLWAIPSTFRHLVAGLAPTERFPSVRIVRLGGEPLFRRDVERFREHFRPDCTFVAGYGSGEAGGIAQYRLSDDTRLPAGQVPAGYPDEGVEILILADDGRAVDGGGAGEVAVRSRYLAEGYWRRPDLTRRTFLPDPADVGTRVYRTGDVGRLRPDGCLELLGRNDEQVKIEGHRVHPGEIETELVEHPAVREAAVAASTQRGVTRLVAYVVPEAAGATDARALRRFLHARLPVHMVPSTFVTLASLPVMASGKVDRAALPTPNLTDLRRPDFVPPRNPREHQIAAIWEKLFDAGPIGATDDFFDLGGDSLLAAAFVAAIEEASGRVVLPSVLLKASTVAELAVMLLGETTSVEEPVTALRASGNQAPVFFVHNDYGRGLYTHALARCLDPDRPFYAVHLHGLGDRALPSSVEAIAADRLRVVRAERPHGPYVLGGHCHGGIVALEMARQLEGAGEQVDVVVLVDTPSPGHPRRAAFRSRGIGRVADPLRHPKDYWGRLRILARSGFRAQLALIRRQLAWAAYRRTIRRHVASLYRGRVALFRVEESPANSPDLSWSTHLPRLEVAVIPGDHHTCITRHVAALGARLEDVLRSPETAR